MYDLMDSFTNSTSFAIQIESVIALFFQETGLDGFHAYIASYLVKQTGAINATSIWQSCDNLRFAYFPISGIWYCFFIDSIFLFNIDSPHSTLNVFFPFEERQTCRIGFVMVRIEMV